MTRASSRNVGKLYDKHQVVYKESSLFLYHNKGNDLIVLSMCREKRREGERDIEREREEREGERRERERGERPQYC